MDADRRAAGALGWYIGGFVYALLPALALLWIRERDAHGLELLLWVFIVTWSTDIGAYFAGRTLRQAQAGAVDQPGQDRRGPLRRDRGGDLARRRLGAGDGPRPAACSLLAPLFALAAQAGDLFESWMKRRAGVKDSAPGCPAMAACSTGSTAWCRWLC